MKTISLFLFVLFPSITFASKYDKIIKEMDQLTESKKNLITKIDIGLNDQGIKIEGMRFENKEFSENILKNTLEKSGHILVGSHHGNETLSVDFAMEFARELSNVMSNINNPYYQIYSRYIFYIIPVLNISGYNSNRRLEVDSLGKSIDPNRDYPDACFNSDYFQLKSTENLAKFIEKNNILSGVTVHGYIGTFTYPWGIFTDNYKTLDEDIFNQITKASVSFNQYEIGTHSGVIYPAVGAFEDWGYFKHGIWLTLLELKQNADLKKDVQAILKYFSLVPSLRSVKNQLTGNCTQQTRSWRDIPSRP